MKINDLKKLPEYIIKVIDSKESLNYMNFKDENSVFVSDRVPLTDIFNIYKKKFMFSKKFTRHLYLRKYIRTGKINYNRNLASMRGLLLKNHVLFSQDQRDADCYDLTLESIAFKESFNPITAIQKFSTYLKDDYFLNNKENISLFWILSDDNLNAIFKNKENNIIDLKYNTLILQSKYKDFKLDPKYNSKIDHIYVLIPFDSDESKSVMGLKFLVSKIYSRHNPISTKEEEINYPRLKAHITKMYRYKDKLSKKDLFDIEFDKDDTDKLDYTYLLHNDNLDTDPNITVDTSINNEDNSHNVSNNNKNNIKKITESKIKSNDTNQIDAYTNGKLTQSYIDTTYTDDLFNMANHAINTIFPNVIVNDMSIENADDGVSNQDLLTLHIKNKENNKEFKPIKLLIPRISDNKFFKLYDKIYTLSNQVYSKLINKIKYDTVAFTTSHTKTIVYIQGKYDDRIGKYLSKHIPNIPSYLEYNISENKYVPNSLHLIFKYATVFLYKNYYISYDVYQLDMRLEDHHIIIGIEDKYYPQDIALIKNTNKFKDYIKKIYAKYGRDSVIIYNIESDSINNKPFLLEMKHYLENNEPDIKSMPIPGASQFARMNIAGKKLPVIIVMLISYIELHNDYNISGFFNKYFPDNVHVDITEKKINEDNIISMKCSDGYLNIYLYQSLISAELLFSIFRKIDLSMYSIKDLNTNGSIKLILYSYFNSQKLEPSSSIISIQNAVRVILDPITMDLLSHEDYHYKMGNMIITPKNFIEILYYCVYLLNDRTHKYGNDFSGYRIRNMETIPSMLYKILSNSLNNVRKTLNSNHLNKSINLSNIGLKENALIEEFSNLPTFESFSDLNISNEIGLLSKATYKGFGGINNNRSVSYELRATDPSSLGFIDVGNNVDNLNVGSNRMLPYNPNIGDVRGTTSKDKSLKDKIMHNETLNDFESSSFLSFDTYNEPFLATSADAPRINMASIQSRHGIPLDVYDDLPIKTGIEDSIKHVVSDSFVIKSPIIEDKYKVKMINTEKKEIILTSNTNKEYTISYKDKVVSNSGGAI